MDLDPWIDPDQDSRCLAEPGGHLGRQVDVVEAIQDYPLNFLRHRALKFRPGLVVAMQHELPGRHPGSPGHVVLAGSRNIQGHSALIGEPGQGLAEEGLRRVGDAVAEDVTGARQVLPEMLDVIDEYRCAEVSRDRQQVYSAHGNRAIAGQRGGQRHKSYIDRMHEPSAFYRSPAASRWRTAS